MKEQRIRFTTALTACSCGAVPYDPDVRPKGQVGLTRYRKSKYGKDGGWSVVCTRCGCVGERGAPRSTQPTDGTHASSNTAR